MFYTKFYPKSFYAGRGKRSRASVRAGGMPFTQSKSTRVNTYSGVNWVSPVSTKPDPASDAKAVSWSRYQNDQYRAKHYVPKLGKTEKFFRSHPRITKGLTNSADTTWRYFGRHIAKGLILKEAERRGKGAMRKRLFYKSKP